MQRENTLRRIRGLFHLLWTFSCEEGAPSVDLEWDRENTLLQQSEEESTGHCALHTLCRIQSFNPLVRTRWNWTILPKPTAWGPCLSWFHNLLLPHTDQDCSSTPAEFFPGQNLPKLLLLQKRMVSKKQSFLTTTDIFSEKFQRSSS